MSLLKRIEQRQGTPGQPAAPQPGGGSAPGGEDQASKLAELRTEVVRAGASVDRQLRVHMWLTSSIFALGVSLAVSVARFG